MKEAVIEPDLDVVRVPLQQLKQGLSDELGVKLCLLMAEALVSMHCRHVDYDWIGHEFRPVFHERIRYLWFLYLVHKDNAVLDFCPQCGVMKTRADKKYCSDKCRKNANR